MKKLIALLLAAVMLLSMTACGGSAEPIETAPATTEAPTTASTEVPTEEPTEAPTEAPTEPRVAPTDFEAVDPETLPEPVPVEEQLQSEDTQTVTLGSLEEYEDLLWSLGFKEVRLAGVHQIVTNREGFCEPVSLTYNDKAFRFDFSYCITTLDGTTKEDGWYMYGTKSNVLENITNLTDDLYYENKVNSFSVVLDDSNMSQEEALAAFMESLQSAENVEDFLSGNAQKQETEVKSSNFEEKLFSLVSRENDTFVYAKAVYYPITGNLYNYTRDINSEATAVDSGNIDTSLNYEGLGLSQDTIGLAAEKMCFHYLFPAEDAAE